MWGKSKSKKKQLKLKSCSKHSKIQTGGSFQSVLKITTNCHRRWEEWLSTYRLLLIKNKFCIKVLWWNVIICNTFCFNLRFCQLLFRWYCRSPKTTCVLWLSRWELLQILCFWPNQGVYSERIYTESMEWRQ